jgi:hypothetical protein
LKPNGPTYEVSKEHFVNKLRELGYKFKRQADNVDFWRLKGGTHTVPVPRRDYVSEPWARTQLRLCKTPQADIDAFVALAKRVD